MMDEKRAALILKLAEEQAPSLGVSQCRIVGARCMAAGHSWNSKPLPQRLVCHDGMREAEKIERDGRSYNRMKAVDAIAKELLADMAFDNGAGGTA